MVGRAGRMSQTMSEQTDFEAEGLLAGTAGRERADRETLLGELSADGVSIEELRAAIAGGRLALVAVERELAGPARYSSAEIAELSGVDQDLLERNWQALGMVAAPDGEPFQTKDDLEAAHRLRTYLDAGLSPEMVVANARVIALTMSQFAAANREGVAALASDEATELELSERFKAVAQSLVPLVGPTLEHAYKLHLREQIRHAVIVAPDDAETGGDQITIAFADLVGFTRLGERLAPDQLGAVSGRLAELGSEVSGGPVRLVKLIGDAVMFGSTDPRAMLDAVLDLVDAAEAEPEGFPPLRAGVALGPAVSSGGDYYGRAANIASRITAVARPSSVLVTEDVRDALGDAFQFHSAGHKSLKGIDGAVHLFRARDLEENGDEDEDDADERDDERDEAPGDEPQRDDATERPEPRGRRARRRRRHRP